MNDFITIEFYSGHVVKIPDYAVGSITCSGVTKTLFYTDGELLEREVADDMRIHLSTDYLNNTKNGNGTLHDLFSNGGVRHIVFGGRDIYCKVSMNDYDKNIYERCVDYLNGNTAIIIK